MHQPSGLLDRLSPTPLACPLVRLGHNSSSADETSTSNVSDQNYNYHCQYIDSHQSNNLGSRFHSKKIPVDNSYLQKQADTEFLQKYYQRQPYSDDHETAPLTQTNLYQKQNTRDLSSLSLSQSYWEHNDNKISNQEDPTYYRAVPKTHIQHHTSYLLDNFTLGKSSPTFDQGYHTLVSPSPGSLTTHIWAETNITKGKKYQNKNNSFDRLPDELTLKIFSFLSAGDLSVCARVCRKFDILVWTPSLWKSILIDGGNINGDKAIKGILRQLCGQGRTGTCPSIEKVRVADGRTLSDKSLLLIARRCPELVHLQLQSCTHITNTALFEIATRCHNLQHLDVSGCVKISCISINGPEPARRLQLQYIDLTDCPALQDNGLRIIVCNCPQLAYLYLRRCIQITDSGLKYVPSFCSSLKELSVSDCVNMTDFGLYELAKLGAALRYLSVAKCDQVSDAGLKVIARKCYKLRYLNARGCEAVSDDAITVLARSCTRLRALDIGKCDVSDAGLRALAESCPNLKKLSLRNCDLVTDRGVQCIAYFCRGLQQLNIQDCQITLEGYRAVKMYCKRCVIEHTNPGFF